MKKIIISYSHNDIEAIMFIEVFKREIKNFDFEIVNLEKLFENISINKNITEEIYASDVFICFVNKSSSNVMFELGFAIGIGKNVIVIGEHSEIPADLQGIKYYNRSLSPYELISFITKYISDKSEAPINIALLDINKITNEPELLGKITALDFKNIIKKHFTTKGYEVIDELGKNYDFKLRYNKEFALVEIKKYNYRSKVSIEAVRQLEYAMLSEKIRTGLLISSSHFTKAARSYASTLSTRVLLWTLEDLVSFSAPLFVENILSKNSGAKIYLFKEVNNFLDSLDNKVKKKFKKIIYSTSTFLHSTDYMDIIMVKTIFTQHNDAIFSHVIDEYTFFVTVNEGKVYYFNVVKTENIENNYFQTRKICDSLRNYDIKDYHFLENKLK